MEDQLKAWVKQFCQETNEDINAAVGKELRRVRVELSEANEKADRLVDMVTDETVDRCMAKLKMMAITPDELQRLHRELENVIALVQSAPRCQPAPSLWQTFKSWRRARKNGGHIRVMEGK